MSDDMTFEAFTGGDVPTPTVKDIEEGIRQFREKLDTLYPTCETCGTKPDVREHGGIRTQYGTAPLCACGRALAMRLSLTNPQIAGVFVVPSKYLVGDMKTVSFTPPEDDLDMVTRRSIRDRYW